MRRNVADILGIGAQRAMTTWLHQLLQAHPGVSSFPDFSPVTSSNKEAHYWDWNHRRGEAWYRTLMRPLGDAMKSLDITPEYAFLGDEALDECKRLSPDARVIYLLRDPLARAVSALRMRTLWASDHAPAEAIRLTMGAEFLDRCQQAALHDHGAYAANLRRWRARYPDLLVMNVEAIIADPDIALDRILTHCALPMPDPETLARLRQRARNRVWATPAYALSPDCLDFLDGLTWADREAIATEGFTFTEGTCLRGARP